MSLEKCPKCGAYVMASDDAEAKWRALAARLAEAERLLRRCNRECGELHHERREYHESGEPCPVEARIREFLGDAVNEGERRG